MPDMSSQWFGESVALNPDLLRVAECVAFDDNPASSSGSVYDFANTLCPILQHHHHELSCGNSRIYTVTLAPHPRSGYVRLLHASLHTLSGKLPESDAGVQLSCLGSGTGPWLASRHSALEGRLWGAIRQPLVDGSLPRCSSSLREDSYGIEHGAGGRLCRPSHVCADSPPGKLQGDLDNLAEGRSEIERSGTCRGAGTCTSGGRGDEADVSHRSLGPGRLPRRREPAHRRMRK